MSKTHRSDSAYIPGYHHSGDRGLGFLGSAVPSSGTHGPALLYPGLTLPAEANDEFRIVILTVPSGLTFFNVEEDSSLIASAPNGTYVGTYEGFKNGVSYGTSTYTLNWGDGLTGTITFDEILASGGIQGADTPPTGLGASIGPRVAITSTGDLLLLF